MSPNLGFLVFLGVRFRIYVSLRGFICIIVMSSSFCFLGGWMSRCVCFRVSVSFFVVLKIQLQKWDFGLRHHWGNFGKCPSGVSALKTQIQLRKWIFSVRHHWGNFEKCPSGVSELKRKIQLEKWDRGGPQRPPRAKNTRPTELIRVLARTPSNNLGFRV